MAGPSSGVRLTLSVRNLNALQANFRAFDEQLQAEVRSEVHDTGEFTRELAQQFAPVSADGSHGQPPGFLRDHIKTTYSSNGFVFETGWDGQDFFDVGKPPYFFFTELGTVHMPAQPALSPAYAEARPRFETNIRNAVKRSVARGGRP